MTEAYDEIAPEGNRVLGARARAVVDHVARSIAEEPDAIALDVDERSDDEIMILIHAAPDDLGRLIGKRGRVIQSLRQLTRAAAASEGVRAGVDIVE